MVPLETLPYWPKVDEPTPLVMLWVILGVPIVFTLLIALLVKSSDFARSLRTSGRRGRGAYWVNPGRPPLPVATDVSEDGSPYTMGERDELLRAARRAEEASGFDVSIFVGPSEGGRAYDDYAVDLFETLNDPERTILFAFDPETRALELVLGDDAEASIDSDRRQLAMREAQGQIEQGKDVLGILRAVAIVSDSDDAERVLADAEHKQAALAH